VAAFISSIIATILMVAVCLYVGARRPIGTPVTWGEAMVAGTWVFAIMLLIYGIVPHQWLNYADNELLWRPDKLLVGISSGGVVWGNDAKDLGGTGRILINYQAIRDIVATVIYVVGLGGQMYLWSVWQKRGRKKPGDVEEARSRFGRPVLRKA
jgi:formate hydrogenlyase subunit 3/multisubunit Na+/H+ antiporter MnhD subunit